MAADLSVWCSVSRPPKHRADKISTLAIPYIVVSKRHETHTGLLPLLTLHWFKICRWMGIERKRNSGEWGRAGEGHHHLHPHPLQRRWIQDPTECGGSDIQMWNAEKDPVIFVCFWISLWTRIILKKKKLLSIVQYQKYRYNYMNQTVQQDEAHHVIMKSLVLFFAGSLWAGHHVSCDSKIPHKR